MPGSRNLIGWNVITPSHEGTCKIRIGDTPDERLLQILHPIDGSSNEDGSFPCGRI